MKKSIYAILVAVFVLMMSSCTTKQSAMNSLENFSYELRDHSRYYNAEQWKKSFDRFGHIRKNIAKHDYTASEKMKIGKLEGQCAKYMAQGAKDGILDNVTEWASELQGILDAFGIGK